MAFLEGPAFLDAYGPEDMVDGPADLAGAEEAGLELVHLHQMAIGPSVCKSRRPERATRPTLSITTKAGTSRMDKNERSSLKFDKAKHVPFSRRSLKQLHFRLIIHRTARTNPTEGKLGG